MKEQTSATNNTATETVLTLASMSKRVVADMTNQRSIPHELASIIPHHPSLMICPIIMEGETPYGMFSDFQSYPWVQPIWYGAALNVVNTFCRGYQWNGKRVFAFATSGGSGIGRTAEKLTSHVKGAASVDAKLVHSAEEVKEWVRL